MQTRMIVSLGLSALVLGGATVGCTATRGGLASAGTRDAAVAAKVAARDADLSGKALVKGQTDVAVAKAESAVALMPQNANYRALLGQGYLKAGRFDSARAAFADALTLAPADGRSALNLTLAQIALGDWQAARDTLAANVATIPAGDRGLALALAGDPAGGAAMLTDVVRSGAATPKNRQNLALALALAGQWQAARVVAAADMSPADVDRRIEEWAAFTKPRHSSDQVAVLLGVRAAEDPGQPVSLALVAPVSPGAAVAQADAPTQPIVLDGAAPEVAAALAAVPVPAAKPADIELATRALTPVPVAQPAPLIPADPRPMRVAMTRFSATAAHAATMRAAAPIAAKGGWFVQVGAFRNPAVARDGWRHATRRMPSLAQRTPTNARFAAKGGALYRLAFGGLARNEADAMCRRYRASGGACFVRAGAGDRVAQWAAPKPVQLASR